ncbi:MAG: UTP--glucose-1-phosphate uridylyltransferase [Firmicutes bacterium]|nr:UTP--glucose-1-phosphate uridylyltransferase [Bacillota bacterium]
MRKPIRKVVIPAAGLGTRFLPATKAQPKEMLPIVDKPSIQYIVEEAVASGIEDVLIITGRNKRAIEDHFDVSFELEETLRRKHQDELLQLVHDISELVDIHYIRQKEPLGLGHAVWCARKFIGDEPFAVMLGDDLVYSAVPVLKQMVDVYEEYGGSIIGVQQVPLESTHRYGICDVEPASGSEGATPADRSSRSSEPTVPKSESARVYRIRDLVEKPTPEQAPPSRLAIMGRYIIEPEVFGILGRTEPGAGSEIQLTDALRELAKTRDMYAYVFEGRRYDVGDKLGFLEATVEYALRDEELAPAFGRYLRSVMKTLEK